MSKQEKKLQVEILRQTVAAGDTVRSGDIVTLPEGEAKYLINIKKAVETDGRQKDVRHGKAEAPKAGKATGGKAGKAGKDEDTTGAAA